MNNPNSKQGNVVVLGAAIEDQSTPNAPSGSTCVASVSKRRQHPCGRYILDFVCLEARLVIELDGGQHQGSANDRERDAWLQAQGFQILRFWNHDVLTRPDAVLERLFAALSPA